MAQLHFPRGWNNYWCYLLLLVFVFKEWFQFAAAQSPANGYQLVNTSSSASSSSLLTIGPSPLALTSNNSIYSSVVLLNVAIVMNLTDPNSQSYVQAINFAFNEINSNAVYNTRMFLTPTFFNTNGNVSNAVNITNSIINSNSPVFASVISDPNPLSSTWIARTLNSSTVPTAQSILHISTVSATFLSSISTYFRLAPSDAAQVDPLVDYAFFLNVTDVYVVTSDDLYFGPAVVSRLQSKALFRGINVVSVARIKPSTDPTSLTNSMLSSLTSMNNVIASRPYSYDANNNRSIPHIIFALLPTSVFDASGANYSYAPFDVAFANAVNSVGWLRTRSDPTQQVLLLLSTDLFNAYTTALASSASSASKSAAQLMELMVGVQPAVGIFKTDNSLILNFTNFSLSSSPSSSTSSPSLTVRYYYDSVYVLAKTVKMMLLNGTDPTIGGKLQTAVLKTSFVGSSGSISFSAQGDRLFNRFAFAQLSATGQFGSANVYARTFAYWYPVRGFVPNNASYRADLLIPQLGAANFLIQQPVGMPAYVPGYWQWTPLPASGIPPSPRFGHCMRASTVFDTLFVYSGTYSSAQSPSLDAYTYSFANNFWYQLPIGGTTKPRPAFYPFCGIYDSGGLVTSVPNALYVFGGVNSDGVKGELWRMDLQTYTWTMMSPTFLTSGALPIANTLAVDRAEGGYLQLPSGDKLLIVGGFHRTMDQESITILDMSQGDNATMTVFTPYYSRYSFLQNNQDWYTTVSLVNGANSSNPVLEMAACLNTDPNPILAATLWTDPSTGISKNLVFIIGGGLMPQGVALIYRVEDNTIFPFFMRAGSVTSPDGFNMPVRDISLTVSGNYRNGYIYVIDGWSDSTQANYKNLWQLDVTCVLKPFSQAPTCGIWTYLAQKPTETRDSYRPFLYGTDLVMFGGWGLNFIHNDMYTYSLTDGPSLGGQSFVNAAPDYTAPSAREMHTTVLIGNLMIIFGGRDTSQVAKSDVWQYDIDAGFWALVSPQSAPPSARYGHIAVSINIGMFVFGGTDGVTTFSDLWSFSLATTKWVQILLSSGPSARAYSAAVSYQGAEIVVFGGMDANGNVLSDMWRYNVNSQTFVQVFSGPSFKYPIYSVSLAPANQVGQATLTVNIPDPTYLTMCDLTNSNNTLGTGGCFPRLVTSASAVLANNLMYFIGGWDAAFNSWPDMCVIDISNFNYPPYRSDQTTPLSYTVSLPPAYIQPGQTTNFTYYSLQNPANYRWNCSKAPLPKSRNSLSVVANGDSLFVYGGLAFELISANLIVYSISQNTWSVINDAGSAQPRPRAGTSLIIYGNKFMGFGGSMAAIGAVHSATFLANEHWQYVLGPACPNISATALSLTTPTPSFSDCTFCTPGTIVVGTTCESCAAGTYSSNGVCTPCIVGFYNPFKGATSVQYCLPCDSGYYNNQTGASACKQCAKGLSCPVATVNPPTSSSSSTTSQLSDNQQLQALPMASNSQQVQTTSNNFAYAVFGVAGFTYVVYCCMQFLNKAQLFSKFDLLFNWSHVAEFDKPMFRRKTTMGGACSFLTIFVILYLIVSLSLPFAIDNSIETRALVPNVSVNQNITAAIFWNVTLSNYPQQKNCVSPSAVASTNTNNDTGILACTKEITVQLSNFGPANMSAANTTMGCRRYSYLGQFHCSVFFYCAECMTQAVLANVSFSFSEPNTYASTIWWSVNSTAAYPSQNSTLWGYVKSEDSRVFRGILPPTIISTKLTPTRWTHPSISTVSSLGYTQFFISQTPGSKILPRDFNSYDGIAVVFAYENQLSTLDVVITDKLTNAQFLSQLLGSISGAIAGLALVMSILEEVEEVILRKNCADHPERQQQGTYGRLRKLYKKLAETLIKAGNEDADGKQAAPGQTTATTSTVFRSLKEARDQHIILTSHSSTQIKRLWALPTANDADVKPLLFSPTSPSPNSESSSSSSSASNGTHINGGARNMSPFDVDSSNAARKHVV